MWLNVYKPYGISSYDVIRKIKKGYKDEKIGYAGTLDPMATGVLPIAIGKSTKEIRFLMEKPKAYTFTVMWGIMTDSIDMTGEIINENNIIPSLLQLESVLNNFIGYIKQIPPIFSAIKINGKRAYKYVRNSDKNTQNNIVIPPRIVHIHEIKILKHNGFFTEFYVKCGTGTYVRSLALDIAMKINSICTVVKLHRNMVGNFMDTDTIKIDIL